MKVYCQLVIMAIYLCHNYIHTALTYIIPVILINSLSILWSNSTMDAQISKLANLLSAHILYAHMHRKDNFCYPVFIIKKNKIHCKEMHWALMELVCLTSKFFMSLSICCLRRRVRRLLKGRFLKCQECHLNMKDKQYLLAVTRWIGWPMTCLTFLKR